MNPIYEMLSSNNMPPILQQFMKFRQSFQGDARTQIQQMLSSGQITQADYDNAVRQAEQLQKMLAPIGRR